MAESLFPLPPQDEVDADGRGVHPYVRGSGTDPSVYGYTLTNGEKVTEEDRSRESRIMFHVIEGMIGHLSPLALIYLVQAVGHRLYTPSLADEMEAEGVTAEHLDPRGELLPFERVHAERLRLILEHADEILARCPRCGRRLADHEGGEGG